MTTTPRPGCGGLILCGGRSSRMGYEKARLRFPDGTLLDRVLGRMRTVASPIALSLAPGQGIRGLADDVLTAKDGVANQGPLWGLAEGFRKLDGLCERVLVMPVDMPFFTSSWMERLLDELDGHRACLYQSDGFANALTAAYSMDLLPKLEGLVAEGRRRPIFLIEGEDAHIIPIEDDRSPPAAGPALMDVDTPEAYREALLLEGIGRAGAAEVTVEIRTPESKDNIIPAGYLALYADRAGDVMAWAERLYPELAALEPGRSKHLLRTTDGVDTPLDGGDSLWRGEHLRLEVIRPDA